MSMTRAQEDDSASWSRRLHMLSQVWRLALPVMLTNVLQTLVNVVDVFMVGRLGPIAIAAVGMSVAIRMLVIVLVLAVAAGAMSLIAQAKGARDPERMSFVTRQAIVAGLMLSLILTVAGYYLAQPLLYLTNSGGDPEAVLVGTQYLKIIFLGTPFLVLNIVINRMMQGAGDTLTPLILTGSMNLINIALNALFMFGLGPIPAFDVAGAAMGTFFTRFLGVVAALMVIYSGRNVLRLLPGSYRPNWRMFADILTIGVPSGLQGVFRNGARLLLIGIVTSTEVGTYGAAALAIGFQVESLAFMPGLGINVAATSLVGQALGSWQTQEARLRGTTAIFLGLVVMAVLATPLVIFAPAIILFFDPSAHPTLLSAGTAYMRINTVVLPLSAIAIVANGALRGAGDTFPGMVSTILSRAIVALLLAYVLAFPLGLGSLGVWLALAVSIVVDAIYMGLRWRSQVWLSVALFKTELYRQHLKHLPEHVQAEYLREVRAPLMAQATMQEKVDTEKVTYSSQEEDIVVYFQPDSYQLIRPS